MRMNVCLPILILINRYFYIKFECLLINKGKLIINMFKNDISYSNKQKAIRFTEDSKNFLVSLNEALVVLKYTLINLEKKLF